MSFITYPSTLDPKIASGEIEDITSSQILLSRGVAGQPTATISLSLTTAPQVGITAAFESEKEYAMTLRESKKTTDKVHVNLEGRETVHGTSTALGSPAALDDESANTPSFIVASVRSTPGTDVLHSRSSTAAVIICDDDRAEGDRGRTLKRPTTYPSRLSSTGSLLRREKRLRELAKEVCAQVMERQKRRNRTLFESRSLIEHELLEPYPYSPVCDSVSALMSESLSGTEAGGGKPHLANDIWHKNSGSTEKERSREQCNSRAPYQHASVSVSQSLAPTLQLGDTFQSLSFTATSESATDIRQPAGEPEACIPSAASRLPVEIIHRIYLYLGPVDFNAARRVSRLWFVHSLDGRLLETMLHRGAWLAVLHREHSLRHTTPAQSRVSDEWLMSKILSRECALGPDWTGDGISNFKEVEPSKINQHEGRFAFKLISESDFSGAGINYPGTASRVSGLLFTASNCGKFVTVAHGCLVFIYELNRSHIVGHDDEHLRSGAIKPVTTVICPRRVISCSMDASCNRNVAAILMDGRMGLVCPISGGSPVLSPQDGQGNPGLLSTESIGKAVRIMDTPRRSQINVSPMEATQIETKPSSCLPMNRKSFCMEIESSTPSIYSPLCTIDDPPRSVALCPQRCCVAFGCSTGIELHWVDALTGQDLSRWFPLTTPSDYLYFLPPRDGVDTARKLRLISSAGRPGERTVIADRYGSGDIASSRGLRRSILFERLTKESSSGGMADTFANGMLNLGSELGQYYRDHFRAVPVADGYHVLFTDPLTGLLCLGTDAPVGEPTKLHRKICFKVSPEHGSPVVYSSGNNLRRGLKIAAAYGIGREQSIWFFSVPADVLAESQIQAGSKGWMNEVGRARLAATPERLTRCEREVGQVTPLTMMGLEPLTDAGGMGALPIRGQFVGKMDDIVDLAVDSGPQMTIWAFSRSGTARTWKLDDGSWDGIVRKRIITRDGSVRSADGEGDVEMTTASHAARDEQTFDGTASLQLPEPGFADRHDISSDHGVEIDADGDVSMEDSPRCGYGSNGIQGLTSPLDAHWVGDDGLGLYPYCYSEQVARMEFGELVRQAEAHKVERIDIEIQ